MSVRANFIRYQRGSSLLEGLLAIIFFSIGFGALFASPTLFGPHAIIMFVFLLDLIYLVLYSEY